MGDKSAAIKQAVADLPSHQPQLTSQHLQQCCSQFRELTPKVSKYIYDNGQEYKMICLSGTIPMPYRGNTYNIPVNIWVHGDYPNQAPIVLVTPTRDMQIKPSKIVDSNGRVYLPYLHEWRPSSGYDLLSLVNILCMEFSSAPPLYAKSAAQQQQPAPARPRPSYPATTQGYAAKPGGYSGGYANNTPPNIGWSFGGTTPGNQTRPPAPTQASNTGFGQPTLEREDTKVILKNSMISKIEHDLKNRYQIFNSRYEAEMNAMRQQEQELLAGKDQIREVLDKIEQEKEKIRETIELFKTKDGELREFLSQHERAGDVEDSIDKQIEPKSALFKQYLNLYAQESALDDAIYYLAEALRNDVIDIQIFLKNVRTLSRKKFMVCALMNKVRQQANKCEIK